jgi:hypothetical protein
MTHIPPELNPYASPSAPDALVQQPIVSSYQLLKDVKQFRAEIHALGGLWIFFGGALLALAGISLFAALEAEFDVELVVWAGFFVAVALPFLISGVATCWKQLWGVYVGLVMSYLMTVISLPGSLMMAAVFSVGIFGGHRIISWAKELRRKRIPLNTSLRDIRTPLQLPPSFPIGATASQTVLPPVGPGESTSQAGETT